MPPLASNFSTGKPFFFWGLWSRLFVGSVLFLEFRVGFDADELAAILLALNFLKNSCVLLVIFDFWVLRIVNTIGFWCLVCTLLLLRSVLRRPGSAMLLLWRGSRCIVEALRILVNAR